MLRPRGHCSPPIKQTRTGNIKPGIIVTSFSNPVILRNLFTGGFSLSRKPSFLYFRIIYVTVRRSLYDLRYTHYDSPQCHPMNYLGKVLDEKYRLERLLGQGGMGAVYLATHLGTERYVALKLITPQFMRNEEFVHASNAKRAPPAVCVIRTSLMLPILVSRALRGEDVAYLVMEYLDGCTLGDVLKKRTACRWIGWWIFSSRFVRPFTKRISRASSIAI